MAPVDRYRRYRQRFAVERMLDGYIVVITIAGLVASVVGVVMIVWALVAVVRGG